MLRTRSIAVFVTVAALAVLGGEPGPVHRDFVLIEYLNHDWPSQILNYHVEFDDGECHVRSLVLMDAESGERVPFQLSNVIVARQQFLRSATLSFFGTLPANGRHTYRLSFGPKEGRAQEWEKEFEQRRPSDTSIQLANSKIAVQLAAGSKTFQPPVAVHEVPPPLQRVRGVDRAWRGSGWWNPSSSLEVKQYRCELSAEGPMFLEYQIQYEFVAGEYVFHIRLYRGQSYFTVSEKFNVVEGEPVPRERDLNRDVAGGDHHTPPDKLTHFQFSVYPDFAPDREQRILNEAMPVQPLKYDKDQTMVWLQSYCLWTRVDLWRPFYSVFSAEESKKDYLSVFTIHPGSWEDPTVAAAWTGPERNAIGVYMRKSKDLFYDFPITEGTREWGMLLTDKVRGGEINPTRIYLSEVPLDLVKDWVLEWPRDEKLQRPSLWFRESERDTIRKKLGHPLIKPAWQSLLERARKNQVGEPSALGFLYSMTGDQHYARLVKQSLLRGRAASLRDYSYKYLRWGKQNGFRVSPVEIRRMSGYAYGFDAVADSGVFSETELREVRARMAFIAYTLSSPDYMAWQFAVGNADFDADRYAIVGSFGLALADHPHAAQWVEHAVSQFDRQMRFYVSEGSGRWIENPGNYYLHTWRVLMPFLLALHHCGDARPFEHPKFKAFCDFSVKISTPPTPAPGILTSGLPEGKQWPEIPKVRRLPGIGDTGPIGPELPIMQALAAYAYRELDPALARRLMWTWRRSGRNLTNVYHTEIVPALLFLDPEIPDEAPDLRSQALPEYGAVLRSGFNTPNETYLLFKSGMGGARFHNDEHAFVFYFQGIPLCLDGGWGWDGFRGSRHSTVTFGDDDYFAPRGELARLVALDQADLAIGRMPPSPAHFSRFDRHILFVKNGYLLIGDHIETAKSTAWHLPLAMKEIVLKDDRALSRGRMGLDVMVQFLGRREPLQLDLIPAQPPGHQTLRARREPGESYYVAILPHASNDPPPEVSTDGLTPVVHVKTRESADVVVLAPDGASVADGDFRFQGRCGLSRRYADGRLALVLVDGRELETGAFGIAAETVSVEAVFTKDGAVSGSTFGNGGKVEIRWDEGAGGKGGALLVDGRATAARRGKGAIRFRVASGFHRFRLAER